MEIDLTVCKYENRKEQYVQRMYLFIYKQYAGI